MYSKNSSPYRDSGFGQIDPFERKSSFDVPHSDTANIPKNYRGIYFSQKRPEPKKKDAEESVIRHTAPERQEKSLEPHERKMPIALPLPCSEEKAEKREPNSDKAKKEGGDSHRLDPEELLIAGLIIVLLREGANDMLPLELALLLL